MASTSSAVAVFLVGIVVACALYVSVSDDVQESTGTVEYSASSYTYEYTFPLDSYQRFRFSYSIDGEVIDSYYWYNIGVDDGDCQFDSDSSTVFLNVSIVDYTSLTLTFTIDDSQDHSVSVYFGLDKDGSGDIVEELIVNLDLAADGSTTEAQLLLSTSAFWAAFVAGVAFVIFTIIALMIYAAGGRR